MTNPAPVLVVGAGPTGLVLALSLARRGVALRIVDAAPAPGTQSRAMGVQARTLEFYRQFGFADEVVAAGIVVRKAHLREGEGAGAHGVAEIDFDGMGRGISPFPFMLCYPQDDHERFLVDKLRALGVEVERGVRLAGFSQDAGGVDAELVHADGRTERTRCAWLAGCDGAHSQVRHGLGVGFAGGTYAQPFYVADVRIAGGPRDDLAFNLGGRLLALRMPVRSSGTQRLIGLVPPELAGRDDLAFDDLRAAVEPLVGVRVEEVHWFSAYRVHHRVAERFRVGRAFLLGDAGHLHSPAGAQGMNTGIGDAVNLGWKLAQVVRGRAAASLLDTYEPERIAFARQLVATTDRVFSAAVGPGLAGTAMRKFLMPAIVGTATRFDAPRKLLFRTVSQVHIHYPDSPLSAGRAGSVSGGDRLPWGGPGADDNFAPLASLDWQLHIVGAAPRPALREACDRLGLALHGFGGSAGLDGAGFARDAAYLVRPDGHVGLCGPQDAVAEALDGYVQRHGLVFGMS